MIISIVLLSIIILRVTPTSGNVLWEFPESFKFGVSTAAYQIEGAWNISDKGENIWDRLTHTRPSVIWDESNADKTCDSYHNYERDVEMLVELGVDFYRFSISWSRLLPTGFSNQISKQGLAYYDDLIDELIHFNITPLVTLYHWDLPQTLQDLGGWTNPLIVKYFEDYARVVFENYGDQVKNWITINEIPQICVDGYAKGINAPQVSANGIGDYLCAHHALLAHAKVWHLYNDEYRHSQGGRVGIVIYTEWVEPESTSKEDIEIAERGMQFLIGWQAHAIFSSEGDYPKVLKDAVLNRSLDQGYASSRLPTFTEKEIDYVKGSSDFLGLNYYNSIMLWNTKNKFVELKFIVPSREDDLGYDSYFNENWTKTISPDFTVFADGLKYVLKWVKKEYNNIEVIITENGYPSYPGLGDLERINYINQHLIAVWDAMINNDCNVTGYSVWSLMDNFEWISGYGICFGLYEVDFKSEARIRTARASALVYEEIIRSRTIKPNYFRNVSQVESKTSTLIILLNMEYI
ncbi:myrosinase 1-like [Arctopsyche grandis]|uniref:myrosinase 1-like n=1 Tax=Arctopsyche grandis TaxID=121162 RepID=UPI00406D7CB3